MSDEYDELYNGFTIQVGNLELACNGSLEDAITEFAAAGLTTGDLGLSGAAFGSDFGLSSVAGRLVNAVEDIANELCAFGLDVRTTQEALLNTVHLYQAADGQV